MRSRRGMLLLIGLLGSAAWAGGCAEPVKGPVVYYLDGAGWYSSSGSVQRGLQLAGYTGSFTTHSWSAFLGPPNDHFVIAPSKASARPLAKKIQKLRQKDPEGRIVLMGLSAGTSLVLHALEQLPLGVQVDYVVLLSPTVSAEHDLTKAMQHVKRKLYATCSPHDGIAGTLAVNADGKSGPPAGCEGFKIPPGGATVRAAYERVVMLPWQPSYVAFDWSGSHTSVTNADFIRAVIAPRVLNDESFPLDRSLTERALAGLAGVQP